MIIIILITDIFQLYQHLSLIQKYYLDVFYLHFFLQFFKFITNILLSMNILQ